MAIGPINVSEKLLSRFADKINEVIRNLGDVTSITNVASSVHGATQKSTPVGADEVLVLDSAASFVGKRSTLTELFAQAFAISTTTLLAVASELWTGTSTAKAVTPDALTDAHAIVTVTVATTTFTPDQNAGINFLLTLTDNSTLAMMSNLKSGRNGFIWVVQDAAGTNTLDVTAYMTSAAIVVAAGANEISILGYQVNQAGTDVALWLVGANFT